MYNKRSTPQMLYLMHVPWGWIKQRPHFIAEKLSKFFSIEVAEKRVLLPGANKKLPNKNTNNLNIKDFFAIPLYNPLVKNNIIFDFINKILFRLRFKISNYKYIWITSISGYYRIKDLISSQSILVYDCMDDELEFPKNYNLDTIKETERLLVERADYIFCTSDHLKKVIVKRTGTNKPIYISNNASSYPSETDRIVTNDKFQIIEKTNSLVYIGTISQWFDFEIIQRLLADYPTLELFIIGPIDTKIPVHDRIKVLGTCKHEEIWGIMRMAKILVMPFYVTPLIESVNPVKLYEYIWAQKPIIATKYGESQKFANFVHLYSSYKELRDIVSNIIENNYYSKYTVEEGLLFLKTNDWDSRVAEMVNIILSDDNIN